MDRTVRRSRPLSALRLWSGDDWPVSEARPLGSIAAEWAGRSGHPTSYALLGAVHGHAEELQRYQGHGVFVGALSGDLDEVTFGLPAEYLVVVEQELPGNAYTVLLAAGGKYGSSAVAFRWVARFLGVLLKEPSLLAADDDSLWRSWDDACPRMD